MSELFDIVSSLNRLKEQITHLKEQVVELNQRIEKLCKNPSLVSHNNHVESETACKLLHVSPRELLKMRTNGEITYTTHHRKILYPLASIRHYLAIHTIPPKSNKLPPPVP